MVTNKIWNKAVDIPDKIYEMTKDNDPNLYDYMKNQPLNNILILFERLAYTKNTDTFINLYPLIISYWEECHGIFKFAAEYHAMDILEYLLDNGIDVTYGDNFAIKYISSSEDDASIVINKMINSGADPIVDQCKPLKRAIESGHINNARVLFDNGGYIKSEELDEFLMDCAIVWHNLDKVKLLFEKGIEITENNRYNIGEAITCNNIDMVEYLLDSGLDPNMGNGFFLRTSINLCYDYDKESNNGLNMMKILLKYGANGNLLTSADLIAVIKNGDIEIIELLAAYDTDFTKINNCKISKKNQHYITKVVNLGVDPIKFAGIMIKKN